MLERMIILNSRWREATVLMSELMSHSFKWLIHSRMRHLFI